MPLVFRNQPAGRGIDSPQETPPRSALPGPNGGESVGRCRLGSEWSVVLGELHLVVRQPYPTAIAGHELPDMPTRPSCQLALPQCPGPEPLGANPRALAVADLIVNEDASRRDFLGVVEQIPP